MASIGTKLFKIASQINVGKETIVAFLQGKGFAIENKATSTLTDDMVDLVLKNFQKEAAAALKQRAKETPHGHDDASHDDATTGEPVLATQTVENQSETATAWERESPALDTQTHQQSETRHANQEPLQAEVVHNDAARANTASEQSLSGKATAVAVGTVIQLEDSSSRRKFKKDKEEPIKKESSRESSSNDASRGEKPLATKGGKPSSAAAQTQSKTTTQETPQALSNEQQPQTQHSEKSAPASPSAQTSATQSAVLAANEPAAGTQSQQPSAKPLTQSSSTGDANHNDVHDDDVELHDEDFDETDAQRGDKSKRKRKKRIGEVEYFVDSAPYATPMPTGLTILGKIELGGGRSNSNPERPRTNEKRGKSVPRAAGADETKPRVKGLPPKAKDWTKENTPTTGKKTLGVVGSSSSAGGGGSSSAANKKKRKKGKREQVSAEEVDKAIRRTLSGQDESQLAMRSRLRQRRKQERADELERQAELREIEDTILRVTEFITAAELADIIGVPTNEIILKCMSLGLMVSINQRLEKDTITLIASDYELEVEFEDAFAEESLEEDDEDDEELLVARAPIVTVMGHVDHGKTSLLDYIRKTSVVSVESGGITQHIGAYSVKTGDGSKFITFLDTPGHQAFTAMRARGAQLTDLVVLVVAADDNVMPQTIEAISHARAANVPMVVAINKIDKPDANPDKVRQQLSDHNVLVEEWGGKFQSAMISAKKGTNIEQLLEKILLEAEILNLRANPDRNARGTVVESKIDKGKGTVATLIVQKGTLRVGDPFLCGINAGRVRAMFNENGERVEEAIPSTPVQILGFDGVPQAGDSFVVMESEVEAREIATTRQQIKREQDFKRVRHVTLDDIASRIKAGGVQELKIILKGDADGSVEALTDSLQKLSTEEVKVTIIHRAVGPILEADVMLAAASDAIIVGFHVRPNAQVAKLAENEGVDIRLYRIIYDCINEVKLALEGMLMPEIKEEVVGVAEIREVFKISKLGNIAGCYMLEGKITRNDPIRVLRDGFEIFTGKLSSLKRLKDDVKEVDAGFECGMAVDGFNDIKTGDLIEAVRKTEVKRKL
ncbi:MAG: translation initiation factor IF-2 [Candidatus Kapabacteria bacterium]|jgi:translation initiation factor IF-2|nr:translation initiation factor IF-2 [Candidatus Kapabacteria bacterium]